MGAEGLITEIKKYNVIEDDLSKYPKLINDVLNRKLYENLALKGRNYAEKYYDWNNNLNVFLDT